MATAPPSEVEQTHEVTEADTAAALGSGSLPVLATPRLLAWLEAATCAALEPTLGTGTTSVGTRVDLQHSRASPVGARVSVTASVTHADGRLRRFTAAARHVDRDRADAPGAVVATAEITRVIVEVDRFMARL